MLLERNRLSETRKIAIYCRVSTEDQAENGYNLREQEKRINQYINAYSEDFPEERISYIDDGFSAKDLNRREMNMLLEDINDGIVSKVVIHNLDRLTRSMKDLIFLIELFEKKEVQLFSLKEKIDTKTAVGRFFVSVIILIAQWEREAISERTIRALDQSAYEGNYVHGRPPFGYRLEDKKLVINEHEASVIKQIYHMYLFDGDSMNQIMHYHGNNHREFGFNWTYDRIRIILTNEIYTGTYRNKRIIVEDHSPQIIDADLFNTVQVQMKNRNRRDSHAYIFRGLCIDHLTKKWLNQKSVVKTHKTYLYYENAKRKRINQDVIDEQLEPIINAYIKEQVMNTVFVKITTLKKRDQQLKELNHYFDIGYIDEDYYIEQTKKLNDKIENGESLVNDIFKNISKWQVMSNGQKRKFVLMNIQNIVVDCLLKQVLTVNFKKK